MTTAPIVISWVPQSLPFESKMKVVLTSSLRGLRHKNHSMQSARESFSSSLKSVSSMLATQIRRIYGSDYAFTGSCDRIVTGRNTTLGEFDKTLALSFLSDQDELTASELVSNFPFLLVAILSLQNDITYDVTFYTQRLLSDELLDDLFAQVTAFAMDDIVIVCEAARLCIVVIAYHAADVKLHAPLCGDLETIVSVLEMRCDHYIKLKGRR